MLFPQAACGCSGIPMCPRLRMSLTTSRDYSDLPVAWLVAHQPQTAYSPRRQAGFESYYERPGRLGGLGGRLRMEVRTIHRDGP